jgi:hypothetical protein
MTIALDLLILILLLAKLSAVELSVVMRVGAGRSLPISLSTVWIWAASWTLWNKAPISASEVATIICLIIRLSTWIWPLLIEFGATLFKWWGRVLGLCILDASAIVGWKPMGVAHVGAGWESDG